MLCRAGGRSGEIQRRTDMEKFLGISIKLNFERKRGSLSVEVARFMRFAEFVK